MRTLSVSMQAAIIAGTVRPVMLALLSFGATTLTLSTAQQDIVWNSITWSGNGWFFGPQNIKESGDRNSDEINIDLSGVPPALVAEILLYGQKKETGSFWLALCDASWAVIASPYLLFSGHYDSAQFSDDGDTSTLTIGYTSDTGEIQDAAEVRMTDAEQQTRYPGDLGFQFIEGIKDWSGYWGKAARPTLAKPKESASQKSKNVKRSK
jgi:hypothetical protein